MAKTFNSGRSHVTPVVRTAFLRALDLKTKRDGLTFSEMLLAEIDTYGLMPVLDKIAKFTERTSDVNVNHSGDSLVSILTSLAASAVNDTGVESKPDEVRH